MFQAEKTRLLEDVNRTLENERKAFYEQYTFNLKLFDLMPDKNTQTTTLTQRVIIEKDSEGFYAGTVSQLKGCHGQAKSIDELMIRMTEAIELCLEAEQHDPLIFEFVGMQRIVVNA